MDYIYKIIGITLEYIFKVISLDDESTPVYDKNMSRRMFLASIEFNQKLTIKTHEILRSNNEKNI